MTYEEELEKEAIAIQKECHESIDYIASKTSLFFKERGYQDAHNAFLYRKLAEMSLEIKRQQIQIDTLYENSHK